MINRMIYGWLIKGIIFSLFLLSIIWLLDKKYIEEGDCVIIVYYVPLSLKDYYEITILGCSAFGLSNLLNQGYINKRDLIFEGLVYVMIISILCIKGNDILASIEINWPHTYHPKPYLKQ